MHIVGYSLHISSAQWTAKHGYQLHAQRAAVSKGNSRSGVGRVKDKCIYGKRTFAEESPES